MRSHVRRRVRRLMRCLVRCLGKVPAMPRLATDHQRLSTWLRTHGHVMTTDEALRIGLSRGAQQHLVAAGRLARMGRGVLVDASAPVTPELLVRAALAQAGVGAVASHRTASGLWKLLPTMPKKPHITVPPGQRVRVAGVVAHQSRVAPEVGWCCGLPVTSASRTLLDLATLASIGPGTLQSCVDGALSQGLTAVPKLVAMVAQWPGERCPGGPRLMAVLDAAGHLSAPEASALERRMLVLLGPLCERAGLPPPSVEHRVRGGRYRLDFAWPDLMITVEVDGYVYHSSPQALARDLARRNELANDGWLHLAFTWHDVVHRREHVEATIVAAFHRRLGGDL